MAKKKEKTAEEIAENLRIKEANKAIRNLISRVKNSCKTIGLRPTELQLDFIREHPNCELPKKNLTVQETISAYETGISNYKSAF